MRRIEHFFLLIALLLWVSSSQAQNNPEKASAKAEQATGTIRGTVLRKDTGEPIHFAHVSLSAQSEKQDDQEDAEEIEQKPATVTTDAAGRFLFTGLVGGKYQIHVSKSGFVEEAYGARQPGEGGLPFRLDAEQHAEGLIFRLTSTGIISGRVRDENGEPMPLAVVSALQTHYGDGKHELLPAMVVVTNDLGEFRLFNLTPGNYLLCVSPGMAIGSLRMASRDLVTVYYPGTTEASQATPVEVQAGVELHGIDIGIQSSKTFHVRGQIVGVSTDKMDFGVAVILHKADNDVSPERSVEVGKDGKFDIEGVMPGSYRVIAILPTEGRSSIFLRKPIEVTGADLNGVILASEGTTIIAGHLKWDDGTEPTKVQLQVSLKPVEEFFSMPGRFEINKDGGFEIKDVMPDLYSIDITGPAPDAYLKSATYGSADAMGTFRVSGAGGSLELLIGAQGARVSGVVTNSDPLIVPGAWVALIPEEGKQKQRRLYQAVKTDASGKYEFRGVAPGNYNLFSWDQVEVHEWEDPEFMKAFEGKGAAISVEEKENKSIDLTLIENRSNQGKQ